MKTTAIYNSLVLATLFVGNQVLAAESLSIDEIIVTSEKLGRSVKETTTSVAVITGIELEERSIDDLYDAVLRTPNVGQSFGEKGFNIRGIDQRGAGSGSGLLINTTVDGASLPSNQATFFGPYSTWDIAQVEILRGPQGTTQGRNAIGGSINVASADPELGVSLSKIRAAVAELGTYQLAAASNIDISDQFALRLSADKRESDGWVENPVRNEDYDARDSLTLRAKALWAPADNLIAKWTTNYTESTGGEDIVNFLEFPEFRRNFSDLPAEEGSEHLINTLQLDYDFNERWSLTSITTLYKHDYVRTEDFGNSPQDTGFLDRVQDEESLSTEIRFNYDNADNLRAVTGLYYGDFDLNAVSSIVVPATLVLPEPILQVFGIDPATARIFRDTDTSSSESNLAVFGELEYDITDRLTLIAGLRADREERESTTIQSTSTNLGGVLPVPLPPDTTEPLDSDFDAVLPKFGLRYQLNDSVTLGFVAQSAYRAGGQTVSAVTNTVSDFDTEDALNYEASLRASVGDVYQISANLFYTDWEDQQVSRPTDISIEQGFNADFITVNAGKSSLSGAELSIDARWADGLSGFASIGLLSTEFDEFVSGLVDNTGNEFAYAPSTNISAGFTYRHPQGYVAIADVNWRDDQFSTNENLAETVIDSYALFNLKLGYESDSWSVYGFARNVFDEEYATQVQPGVFAPNGALIQQSARTGEPRVVGIEFNLSWGG